MGNRYFRFKQFTVWHDQCAMKVGTDGVLLGAWCGGAGKREKVEGSKECSEVVRILDVGTGSGLIALMLAQRLETARIDAIDIVPEAVAQALGNFSLSPWSDRLSAHLSSLQQWLPPATYDLIVSNPPYFTDSLKNPDKGREMARHTDTLSYDELLEHSARLLNKDGILALILPATTEEDIIAKAAWYGLYPTRLTRVYSKPGKPSAIRILIELAKGVTPVRIEETETLYIEAEDAPRSEAYAEMTREFYL